MGKTYYYSDELNDDFANNNIKTMQLPPDYAYFKKNPLRRAWAFFLYHVIALPVVFILQKTVYAEKTVGRKKLKPYRKNGYYIYGNHTRAMGDAYMPALTAFPKKAYIIAGPDAVSIPAVRPIVEDLGAIPLASDISGKTAFRSAIRRHAELGHIVAIYPEAHIWPGYTGIRHFRDGSFRYPVEFDKPMFTATCTYHKRRILPGARTVLYIDGPFFADKSLDPREARSRLCADAYEAMSKRAASSTYSPNAFVPIEKKPEDEKQNP